MFFFFFPDWYLRDTATVKQLELCVCNESYLSSWDVRRSKFSARICPRVLAVLEAMACSRMPLPPLGCAAAADAPVGLATCRAAAAVATRAAAWGVAWVMGVA